MIHIATVHFNSDKWIDIQLEYLRRNLRDRYRVVANLQGVPGQHDHKFDELVVARGHHPGKLNLLASVILETADHDDLVMFLDGDAFPIVDPMPTIRKGLDETVLVAVRREENQGDQQPHPCFAVIRAADWARLRGDWSAGYCWPNTEGKMITDAGGNLLARLRQTGEEWTPLVRTNRVDWHPILFAIYGDIVYHHGSGFRGPLSRGSVKGKREHLGGGMGASQGRRRLSIGATLDRVHDRQQVRRDTALSERVFAMLASDPQFFRSFQ